MYPHYLRLLNPIQNPLNVPRDVACIQTRVQLMMFLTPLSGRERSQLYKWC